MPTLTMMRTVCCEGHKTHGKRCSVCPHRAENREALENYRVAVRGWSFRRTAAPCEGVEFRTGGLLTATLEAPADGYRASPTDALPTRNHPSSTLCQ